MPGHDIEVVVLQSWAYERIYHDDMYHQRLFTHPASLFANIHFGSHLVDCG
jgi:hypothetical protein